MYMEIFTLLIPQKVVHQVELLDQEMQDSYKLLYVTPYQQSAMEMILLSLYIEHNIYDINYQNDTNGNNNTGISGPTVGKAQSGATQS